MEDLVTGGPCTRRFQHGGIEGEAIKGKTMVAEDGSQTTWWTIHWNGIDFNATFKSEKDLQKFLSDGRMLEQQIDEACHSEADGIQ